MRRTLLAAALLTVLAGCGADAPAPATDTATPAADAGTAAAPAEADRAFAALAKRYVDEGLALSPVFATGQGDHSHDAELDDLSAEGRAEALRSSSSASCE